MSIITIRCRKHNREEKLPINILQYVKDEEGQRVMRKLSALDAEIIKGPWQYDTKPFRDGLYCQHCLNEGNRKSLPVDEEDWMDLGIGDKPIVFLDPKRMNAAKVAQSLCEQFSNVKSYTQELAAAPTCHSDSKVLERLSPSLVSALRSRIIGESGQLYKFQTEAIEAVLDGNDLVVTTPTASGKTLTYLLPIFDTLLQTPGATALYLSPLVALTEDQLAAASNFDESGTDWEARGQRFSHYRVCRTLEIGKRSITVARYDGPVTPGDRQHIRRRKPQYLLTTPDMLHYAILNGAFDDKQWHDFFAGLRYVVIDELHTYRGVFGASFANLIRRLLRICRVHGTTPQFLCASATIQEPKATVEKLIGRPPVVVDGRDGGAPQNRRTFVLWSNQVDQDKRALSTQAKDVLLFALRNRVRTIAFGRSISEINDIYRFVNAELWESGSSEVKIMPFMRELRADHKRQIVNDLKQGTVHAVISTTALSMGIDIGSLSAAVIIGFPGSIAELWQQAGRAGRSGDGLIVLIADDGPLDQFFVNHPDVLFNLDAEPVYCNPDNPYIVYGHLISAAREYPITNEEVSLFGINAPQLIKELETENVLEADPQGAWRLSAKSSDDFTPVPLRNLSFSIDVLTEDDRNVIVQVDAARAQRALHKYAHYQHIDKYYEVTRFDVDFASQRGRILVKELEKAEYTTTARLEHKVDVCEDVRKTVFPNFVAHFGEVETHTDVNGYYKVPLFARGEPFQFQPLGIAAPPPYSYRTYAMRLELSPQLMYSHSGEDQAAGLYSLAEAVRLATAVEELCDPSDLASVQQIDEQATSHPRIVIYDATPGGIGITENAFNKLHRILERARRILEECPYCSQHPESRGCPYCVTARYGDETTIHRQVGIEILKELLIT